MGPTPTPLNGRCVLEASPTNGGHDGKEQRESEAPCTCKQMHGAS